MKPATITFVRKFLRAQGNERRINAVTTYKKDGTLQFCFDVYIGGNKGNTGHRKLQRVYIGNSNTTVANIASAYKKAEAILHTSLKDKTTTETKKLLDRVTTPLGKPRGVFGLNRYGFRKTIPATLPIKLGNFTGIRD